MAELIVLIVLWIVAATLFLLSMQHRSESRDDLLPGSRLGGRPAPSEESAEPELNPADHVSIRREAMKHVADLERHMSPEHQEAQKRIAALIAQLQIHPKDVVLRRQLIRAYRDNGNTQAAIDQLLLLADQLSAEGNTEGANNCLREILDLEPWNETAQRRLGLRGAGREATR